MAEDDQTTEQGGVENVQVFCPFANSRSLPGDGLLKGSDPMNDGFKVIVLPANLNDTPHSEDLFLVVTLDEFLRMWRRGETMLRNRRLKEWKIEPDFTGSTQIS